MERCTSQKFSSSSSWTSSDPGLGKRGIMIEPVWLRIVLDVSALVAGAIAVVTFWKNARLKRAEWLYNLHAKFFESASYKRMRRVVDYEPKPEFGNLRAALTSGGDETIAEDFVDYLNFFEFIASLWRLKQLSIKEIAMVFEYYVLRLRDHDFIMHFIATEGFENLDLLIAELGEHRRSAASK
jgi:hypothetical protein